MAEAVRPEKKKKRAKKEKRNMQNEPGSATSTKWNIEDTNDQPSFEPEQTAEGANSKGNIVGSTHTEGSFNESLMQIVDDDAPKNATPPQDKVLDKNMIIEIDKDPISDQELAASNGSPLQQLSQAEDSTLERNDLQEKNVNIDKNLQICEHEASDGQLQKSAGNEEQERELSENKILEKPENCQHKLDAIVSETVDLLEPSFQREDAGNQQPESLDAIKFGNTEIVSQPDDIALSYTQEDVCIPQESQIKEQLYFPEQSVSQAESEGSSARHLPSVPVALQGTLPLVLDRSARPQVLSPFTEEQLRMFYCNPELEQVPVFIDQFLQNVTKDTHEFYDLLDIHYKCRLQLLKVSDQIKTCGAELSSTIKGVWTTEKRTITGEGYCKDKQAVKNVINYDQIKFNEKEASLINKQLKDLRAYVHEDFQLISYNSQLAKIRIECYIHEMLESSILLKRIKSDDYISAVLPKNLSQDEVSSLCMLQDAITILFSFKRLGDVEVEFCKDVDHWLATLVSILQRAGALPDQFFILNHVLRSPPGTIANMAGFIQFANFHAFVTSEVWDSPLVHHFVVMLATLAMPVKERANFLLKYKHIIKPTTMRSMSWTLVDEDREEDENPEDSWYLLIENDLVAVFEQYPFESLFQYLLRMDETQGEVSYSATNSTSNDIVHILAFTSCIVKLLGKLFDTYNMLRYRQFVKRISRTIRWIVQVVSDHWCAYRRWRIEICGDSNKDIPSFLTVVSQFSLERLQLEFDQFFSKATEQILNSQSIGALQFLASFPFDAISTEAAWSLLSRLIRTPGEQGNQSEAPALPFSPGASGEMIFFLTALSNLAISRSSDDKDFIECAARSLIDITYAIETTKEFCERDCRDLLAAVSSSHPFVISTLLLRIGQSIEKLHQSCIYLLKALPFDMWIPRIQDLEQLRSWLLESALDSLQNRMARVVISKMNFDIKQENGELFLPQKFHYTVAVMLVEIYGSCVPDGPGGLKNLEYEDAGFIGQVGALAYQSINKILHSQTQEEFLRWCWDVMLSLKLHASDVETDSNRDHHQDVLLSLEESQSEENGSWFESALSTFQKLKPEKTELEHCPSFLNVQRALNTNGVLACYVTLSMTSMGHSPERFLKHGIKLLVKILEAGWVDPVLRIVSNLIPLFLKCPDLILSKPEFLRIIDTLVHMDASKAGYTEKIWQYPEPGLYSQMLASIMVNHVILMTKQSLDHVKTITSCWFSLLVQSSNWYRDFSVQYLLDQLCKVTQLIYFNMDTIADALLEKFKSSIKLQSNRGLLSSMMSWISTNPPITFLDIKKQPDFSYYAYAVLQMEKRYEDEIGLFKGITSKMALKQNMQLDVAYKKAASHTTASYIPPLQYLTIYRWVDQGLSTNSDHPLLPLIWQQFFMLYLQKQNTVDGLPSRVGVGDRFFDNENCVSLAKKMRAHLYSVASYHKDKSVKEVDDENPSDVTSDLKSHIHDVTMHATLASLYQAMALWLEEPRLHDPNLFLDALPEIYKPVELEKIFQGDDALWLQYFDKNCIEKEVDSLVSLWAISLNKSSKIKAYTRSIEENQQLKPTATQRLIKRLNRESKPKSPFPVESSASPIPEVSMQLLLTRPRLIQELNDDLERVLLFAKKASVNLDEHTALDEEYCELLGDLYENILRHIVLHIPCEGKRPVCSGPAKVIVRYEEKHTKDRNARKLEENRNTWTKDMEAFTKPLPRNLCTGAVYVESVIDKLVKSLHYANANQKIDLESAGIELFYLLATLINNDVKRSHPAIQFFSSSTEVLGKELIADNEAQQSRLVKTIISEKASVSFLAPHFNPRPQLRSFLNLYLAVAESFAESIVTTSFVLLSKFDVRLWLSLGPSKSECVFLARTIITAVERFGKEPANDVGMLFGLYRSHLGLLLSYKFPQQYSEVLRLILEASNRESLPSICWGDFLYVIRCDNEKGSVSPPYENIELQINEASETIAWIYDFFSEASKAHYYSNSKLYASWRLYTPYVARFLKFLFGTVIHYYGVNGFDSSLAMDRFLSTTWNQTFMVYRPWIVPHKADKSWPVLFVEDTILLVQSFTETARLLVDLRSPDSSFSLGMNMLWTFYCAEIASGLNQENSLEIYHGLFATLPWRSFCPSAQDLQRMIELYYGNVAAFNFLGTLLFTVDWTRIMIQYERLGVSERFVEYLNAILRTFVTLSTNKPFMAKTHTKYEEFTNLAIGFTWGLLSLQSVEAVCGWFGENCEPIAVLEEEAYKTTVLRLLKTCCSAHRAGEESHGSISDSTAKQNVYVQMLVKIISRAASMNGFVPSKLADFIAVLLADIEIWCGSMGENDATQLFSSLLILLNSVASISALNCIEGEIHKFLKATNNSSAIIGFLSAAYRVLASLDTLVTLSETTIESYFNRQADDDFNQIWTKVLTVLLVPELNQAQFVRNALSKQCLLTVYAYNMHRLSISNSTTEELGILNETFQWCLQTQPSPLCPEKVILLWWQILNGIKRQAFGFTDKSQYDNLAHSLHLFANYCQQCSEDKSYSGILGVIGLGKKSSFSSQFRLIARSLSVYLLAQMPNGGLKLRCFPDAPGDITGHNHECSASQEAKVALQTLSNLKKNKTYSSMRDDIKWICEFISNPKICLLDGPDLLLYMCQQFFYKVSYIAATVRKETEA